jgi:hypothetical protein
VCCGAESDLLRDREGAWASLHGLTWMLWFARRYSKKQLQIQNDFSGPYTIFAHRRGGE